MYFCCFVTFSPLEKSLALIWTNLNILFAQGCIVPRFIEICPVVLDKKIFKFPECMIFCYYLPLERYMVLHLNTLEFTSPKYAYALCQVWLKLAHWLWRRLKCEKLTERWRDDRQSENLTWAFCSGEQSCEKIKTTTMTVSGYFLSKTLLIQYFLKTDVKGITFNVLQ